MRLNKKSVWGKIDSKGRMECFTGEVEAFLKLHPNRNAVIRIEIAPVEPSAKMKAYYYGYVLPTISRAFYEAGERMTQAQTDRYLREHCPMIQEERYEEGEWKTRVRTFDSLDSAEAMEYIEWLQEYASEHLYTIIDDPV